MALKINNLVKIYNEQRAVDEVSFEVSPGEIVGFLGPNGAGKSTTMKIICGYLAATAGSVEVGGEQISKTTQHLKAQIGYLPEHNPLYLNMYVREYLDFVGKVYKLKPQYLKQRRRAIIEMVGLGAEQHKTIGLLSKGYRQRVGLAKALLHDPPILILDEPTTGLDPNQITDIRNLIKTISKSKTVIFSTHIMQEVQAICDRVIIIDQGKVKIDAKIDYLRTHYQGAKIWVEVKEDLSAEIFKQIDSVTDVLKPAPHEFILNSIGEKDIREDIFKLALAANFTILGLSKKQDDLESIFKQLTQ